MPKNEIAEPIYPCQFPMKVIGVNNNNLEKIIIKLMSSFGEVINPDEMAITHSKNNKYISVTFIIDAKSREYIDQIYSSLNAHKEVKMVL